MGHVSVSVAAVDRTTAARRGAALSTREHRGLAAIAGLGLIHLAGHVLVVYPVWRHGGWLDLVVSMSIMVGVFALIGSVERSTPRQIPTQAFALFLVGAVGVHTWHTFEHIVTFGDPALGFDQAIVELVVTVVATAGVAAPFVAVAGWGHHHR